MLKQLWHHCGYCDWSVIWSVRHIPMLIFAYGNYCCVKMRPFPEWPSQEDPGSGLTASTLVSDVSTLACTNGVWAPLRPVSVAQKNKPSTMLSSNVHYIDLPTDCMAWRFWTMRQSNGCSRSAPRSSAAKQWFEQLTQKKKVLGTILHAAQWTLYVYMTNINSE